MLFDREQKRVPPGTDAPDAEPFSLPRSLGRTEPSLPRECKEPVPGAGMERKPSPFFPLHTSDVDRARTARDLVSGRPASFTT